MDRVTIVLNFESEEEAQGLKDYLDENNPILDAQPDSYRESMGEELADEAGAE